MQFFDNAVLIDTSAALAMVDKKDSMHKHALSFFENYTDYIWVSINATAHETYSRVRYNVNFSSAMKMYNFLTKEIVHLIFTQEDEFNTKLLLEKYKDHKMSFHDALCATIMKKSGIYKVFSFDHHFNIFGFEVLPYI